MARTYLPDRVIIEPNENYFIRPMTWEECDYWGLPRYWAFKKMDFLRYQTILMNLKEKMD